jgi:hypothetical protein
VIGVVAGHAHARTKTSPVRNDRLCGHSDTSTNYRPVLRTYMYSNGGTVRLAEKYLNERGGIMSELVYTVLSVRSLFSPWAYFELTRMCVGLECAAYTTVSPGMRGRVQN